MKIVHIVESFAGGVFEFLLELTNGVTEYEHVIVHGRRENTPLDFSSQFRQGIQFIPWKVGREIHFKNDIIAFHDLCRILRLLEHYDIVHLHSSKAGFLGRMANALLCNNKRVIYTSHGASFLRKDVSAIKRKFFIVLEQIAHCAGGKVIACSASEAKEFCRYYINAGYVSNGIDLEPYIYPKQVVDNSAKIVVGTVGRITSAKNPDLFNDIAKCFCPNQLVQFRWVGDGDLRSKLSASNISITGWKQKYEVVDELSKMDIYLSTSLWEGLPLAVIQAMASGLPLVLSRCAGNIDTIHINKNGYIYDSLDEVKEYLVKLIANPVLRMQMGIESRNLAEKLFCLSAMVDGYKQQYMLLNR